MCAANKAEEKELTLSGILTAGSLMALLGMLLGFVFLASFPLKVFSNINDQAALLESTQSGALRPGAIYYFKGAERAANWESKRRQLLDGTAQDISLTNGELNAWMRAKFRPGVAASTDEKANLQILPGVPNFCALDKDSLYISVSTQLVAFGSSSSYQIFCKGHFSEGPTIRYVVDELRLNNAAIPLTGIGGLVIKTLLKGYSGTQEFSDMKAVWQRLESVELAGNVIRLRLR
jgi:hypothetical protein